MMEPTNNPILENKKSKFNTFVKKPFIYQENDNNLFELGKIFNHVITKIFNRVIKRKNSLEKKNKNIFAFK